MGVVAGADDVESSEDGHDIWTSVDSLHEVAKALESKLGEAEGVKLAWKPTLKSEITDEALAQTLFKLIDTLDDELIAALSAELEAESGHPVMALSGASGAGIEAVLDKLLEAVGQPEPGADEEDDGEASGDWSPI